jgi:hypothetical protein
MKIAPIGEYVSVQFNIEPIPKSTKKPPRLPKEAWFRVLPPNDPLIRTLKYQASLASLFLQAGMPIFDLNDPLSLMCVIVQTRGGGDLKNFVAAIEDALQYSQIVPNDRKIIRHETILDVADTPSIYVAIGIDDRMKDFEWFTRWSKLSKKKAKEHWFLRGGR